MHYRGEGCEENENTARYLLKIAKEAEAAAATAAGSLTARQAEAAGATTADNPTRG
jgi:hypothetical protein